MNDINKKLNTALKATRLVGNIITIVAYSLCIVMVIYPVVADYMGKKK